MLLGRSASRSEVTSWAPFILLFSLIPPGTSSAVADLNAINAAEIFDDCCRAEDSGVYETSEFVFFLAKLEGIVPSDSAHHLRFQAMLKVFEMLHQYIYEEQKLSGFSFTEVKMHVLRQGVFGGEYQYHVAISIDEIMRLRMSTYE